MYVHNARMRRSIGIILIAWSWILGSTQGQPADRPNILWITAEDMSANLGCYGDAFATSPNIDQLAREGVRYIQAYASAPVCSPARSCLITGIYATSLGTQRLRSEFPLPPFARGYATLLRERGYFTSNNVKTDYNIANEPAFIRQNWNRNGPDAHWRQRDQGQPFFSVFNLMTTHQSRTSVWPYQEFVEKVQSQLQPGDHHDPSKVPLPPYYPDSPNVRKAMARYYDCIAVMDQQVGDLLRQLEQDGLAEETIVFFYSDHGMGMPRGKRLLHDSGMHVPLIIRFPEKYSHLAPARPGGVLDRLVSFVDLPPTVLSLAGVVIPDYMQGRAFLGKQVGLEREFVYGARDRVDEVFDLARSVRDDRYLYIRNFMPHLSWMPPEWYSDQAEIRRELVRLAEEGSLNEAQMTYAAATRPIEELYDTFVDPHQIHNLANDPAYRPRLERYRKEMQRWIISSCDLGFLPESLVWERIGDGTPWDLRHDPKQYDWKAIFRVASGVGRSDEESLRALNAAATSDNAAVRYWAAIGLRHIDQWHTLRALLEDPAPPVRIEAAAALAKQGDRYALKLLAGELQDPSPDVVLRATRALELAGKQAVIVEDEIRRVHQRATNKEGTHPNWMFVRFSSDAALDKVR